MPNYTKPYSQTDRKESARLVRMELRKYGDSGIKRYENHLVAYGAHRHRDRLSSGNLVIQDIEEAAQETFIRLIEGHSIWCNTVAFDVVLQKTFDGLIANYVRSAAKRYEVLTGSTVIADGQDHYEGLVLYQDQEQSQNQLQEDEDREFLGIFERSSLLSASLPNAYPPHRAGTLLSNIIIEFAEKDDHVCRSILKLCLEHQVDGVLWRDSQALADRIGCCLKDVENAKKRIRRAANRSNGILFADK